MGTNKINKLREFLKRKEKKVKLAFLIIPLWCVLALFISFKIESKIYERNANYHEATKIEESSEMFQESMLDDIGTTLIYDEVIAANPVSMKELKNEYLAVIKVTERFEVVPVEDEKGRIKKIGSWKQYLVEPLYSETVMFSGIEFPYSLVKVDNFKRLELNAETISEEFVGNIHYSKLYETNDFSETDGNMRYYYKVIPMSQKITVLADLKDGYMFGIDGTSVTIHYDTLSNVIEEKEEFEDFLRFIFVLAIVIVSILLLIFCIHIVDNVILKQEES